MDVSFKIILNYKYIYEYDEYNSVRLTPSTDISSTNSFPLEGHFLGNDIPRVNVCKCVFLVFCDGKLSCKFDS